MNLKKIVCALVSVISLAAIASLAYGALLQNSLPKLIVFHSTTCHLCVEVKNKVMPDIEQEFKGKIEIEYRDIGDTNNYTYLLGLKEKYNPQVQIKVPLFFMEGKFLNSGGNTKNNLRLLIKRSINSHLEEQGLPQVDLIARFKQFEPLAITGIGLVDGINPCAFTVIVFFISFLALQGYRKKELIPIGLSFILAVFLTYILIGLGIFNFLYRVQNFWVMRKIFNISIGVFSIVLGFIAIYDFLKFRKTQETEGMILQLPRSVKNRIHYIIGLHYRKPKDEKGAGVPVQKHIFRLIITALFTGFLVSLIEAICTGQTYLPTIVFILKTSSLKIQALGYLLLYNFMFIVPLLVIFFFALTGATSEQFSAFMKKHLSLIKVLMAVLFLFIGAFLIWRA